MYNIKRKTILFVVYFVAMDGDFSNPKEVAKWKEPEMIPKMKYKPTEMNVDFW